MPAKPKLPTNFVPTWSALADRLGVSRRAIQDWRNDPRYRDLCPPPRTDGRHDIAAWQAFMVGRGLAGADKHVATLTPALGGDDDLPAGAVDPHDPRIIRPPLLAGSQADWSKAETHQRWEQRKLEVETTKGTLLVGAELELPLGATFTALTNLLTQFPERAAMRVTGPFTVLEVMEILREETQADIAQLHAAAYLDTDLEQLVATMPWDAESSALVDAVTFGGQDRPALDRLLVALVRQVLRGIGRRAIDAARQTTDAPLHADTGQVTEADEAAQASAKNTPAAAAKPAPAKAKKRAPKKKRSR